MEEYFAGADLIIHNTQYTQEECQSSKAVQGHISFEYAIAAAKRVVVKRSLSYIVSHSARYAFGNIGVIWKNH
jgi:ribonuclease BN (tRNA processing enzyme)